MEQNQQKQVNDIRQYTLFDTNVQTYVRSFILKPLENCNAINIVNIGDEIVTVNGRPLYPGTPGTINGDSYSVGGNANEIYVGSINISFAGGGANPNLLVEQKFYTAKQLR